MKKIRLHKDLIEDFRQLREAKSPADLTRFTRPDWYLNPESVKAIRRKLGASQSQLASRMHVSIKTLQLHEQKTGALGVYATLLKIFDRHPEVYQELKTV